MVEGMKMIEWHNGEQTHGKDATHLLKQLLHGWNPSTVPALKVALARRGRIPFDERQEETDEQFLLRLHNAGVLTYTA